MPDTFPGPETSGTLIDLPSLAVRQPDLAIGIAQDIHSGLYRDSFPIAEEREPFSAWEEAILRRNPRGPRMAFTITGRRDGAGRFVVDGFSIGEVYRKSSCALLTYAARRRTAARGLGALLLSGTVDQMSLLSCGGLCGIFAECNDPGRVAWTEGGAGNRDVMAPDRRIALFEAPPYSMRRVNLDYFQPPLEPGARGCGDLLLYALPGLRSAGYVEAFVTEFFDHLSSGRSLHTDDARAWSRCRTQLAGIASGTRPVFAAPGDTPCGKAAG